MLVWKVLDLHRHLLSLRVDIYHDNEYSRNSIIPIACMLKRYVYVKAQCSKRLRNDHKIILPNKDKQAQPSTYLEGLERKLSSHF